MSLLKWPMSIGPCNGPTLHRASQPFRNFYVCQGIRSERERETEREIVRVKTQRPVMHFPATCACNRNTCPSWTSRFYAPGSTTQSVAKHKRVQNFGTVSNERSETIYVIPRGSFSSPSSSSPLSTCAFLRLLPIPFVSPSPQSRVRVTLIGRLSLSLFVTPHPIALEESLSREVDESFSSERAHHRSLVFLVRRESIWRGAPSFTSSSSLSSSSPSPSLLPPSSSSSL